MKLYGVIEAVIIALCVAGSLAYMLRSYAPRTWSRGMGALEQLLPAALRRQRNGGPAPTGARAGGCSSCDGCGGCGPRQPGG